MSIDQSVAELEMPERRRFLSLGTGLVTGGAVYATLRALGIVNPSEAYAQDESVNDILRGTPFRDLDINRYWDEVGQGNVFVFIHGETGASVNLARVLAEVVPKYEGKVNFLKYHDNRKTDEWKRFGLNIHTIPTWVMYKDGEEVYLKQGGPRDDKAVARWTSLMDNKIQKIYEV